MAVQRLARFRPGDLDQQQLRFYDAVVGGPRSTAARRSPLVDEIGGLHGPFNAMLLCPELGYSLQELGAKIRYSGALSARVREIAILEVARLRQSDYEWSAHEYSAEMAGLTRLERDALRAGDDADTFDLAESTARSVIRALVIDRDLPDDLYRLAIRDFGQAVLMELVILCGYYDLLALTLRAWRVALPDGSAAVFDAQS